jgi:plasmid stabilization system protein ParE
MYDYLIHIKAQNELEISVEWYAERSEKAVKNFILNIETTLKSICSNPYQYRNGYKNFHELGVKKYPFSIIYFIDESKKLVVVTSVFHHKRNPKKKFIK